MLDRMLLAAGGEEKLYVEDVFSTYLYTGNGSSQTITNGIDLSGKGGLVWIKGRSAANSNRLFDTAQGATKYLISNSTSAIGTSSSTLTSFDTNGFTLGSSVSINQSGTTFASWTFRKAPKFFDVVTYTGTGSARTIAHSLGTAPGCIMIKCTSRSGDSWLVYHRSTGATNYLILNLSDASYAGAGAWNNTAPTNTDFTVGTWGEVNASGQTYVAYLFAHDATADGIIQCGTYTGNGSTTGPSVTLGWEPQWLMIKRATVSSGDWNIFDDMRGMPVGSTDALLQANLANAESSFDYVSPTATGFQITGGSDPQVNASGSTYIYIAIRRGPMKTPTVGTSVFAPVAWTGDNTNYRNILSGFPTDAFLYEPRNLSGSSAYGSVWFDRLRGEGQYLISGGSRSTDADTLYAPYTKLDTSNGWKTGSAPFAGDINSSGTNLIGWLFRRAPGFFDVVCYTPAGVTGTAIKHNLGVAPELVISKCRGSTSNWAVAPIVYGDGQRMFLNLTNASSIGFTTGKPATATEVYENHQVGNFPTTTWVAYLFASCPGVSKVGTYTGNGSSQTINCGFSSGARFFLVKRTDSTGDWWVYDSARGIVAAADPALRLNSTDAEVTSADAVDTDSTGIIVNQEATCNINVNGATYIYLAIA